jgi:hypothetical protein
LSNFRRLGQLQRVFDVDAKIPNGVFDLGVAKQDLDRSEITCCLADN